MSVQLIEGSSSSVAGAPRRSGRTPGIAAAVYIGAWAIGLVAFASAPALDAPVAAVAEFYETHGVSSVLQAALVHLVAGLALLVVVSAMRNCGGTRVAVRAGLVAVGLSLTQFGLEVLRGLGAGAFGPETIDGLFEAVNRLDGAKMLALAVLVGASVAPLRSAGLFGKPTAALGWATTIALVASGVGYLLLDPALGSAAYLSLPLLLAWVGFTARALERAGR